MQIRKETFWTIFISGLLCRLMFAYFYQGFLVDGGCFWGWAHALQEHGIRAFYTLDMFSDYPPGYLYVLSVLGFLFEKWQVGWDTPICWLLLKLPAVLCDMAIGAFIYQRAQKHVEENLAAVLAIFWIFNPAVIFDSSVWGQIDTIYVACILIMCECLSSKKMIPAYFAYIIGALIKPQVIIFTPLLLFGIWENVFCPFSKEELKKNILGGLGALLTGVIVCLPFGLQNVFELYVSTLESYPYATVNGYNVWALAGMNWVDYDAEVFFTTCRTLNYFIVILLCVVAIWIFYRYRKREHRYYVTGAFIAATMFTFSIKMHERYLFPVLILLLFAYIYVQNNNLKWVFFLYSAAHFFNLVDVFVNQKIVAYASLEGPIVWISYMIILCWVALWIAICEDL